MKKVMIFAVVTFSYLIVSIHAYAAETHSGQAVAESGKASIHASKSALHAIIGTGQVTSAASAVPLAVGGSAGALSTEIAKDLMDAATAPIGTPLEITEETVTAGPPPDKALEIKENQAKGTKNEI